MVSAFLAAFSAARGPTNGDTAVALKPSMYVVDTCHDKPEILPHQLCFNFVNTL